MRYVFALAWNLALLAAIAVFALNDLAVFEMLAPVPVESEHYAPDDWNWLRNADETVMI